ncbi:hypothetical protein PSU4_28700 [Pseudonocardia sulfidoxydans NBRC 16205]|uniref:histidine kinase n=1 Tax=Pseudonocardia sulfidoxydans NBRC 16205 TaxID=1223511 RepID=A0A511DGJ8_9PSEU|nr:hypothetical protein [Pseudonocardia sulfidoxydans]GEL23916.1 hypothetical protein PSU4_28700 [Pseudonocardia sulfidoxydans NBRC 16205]
MRDSGQGEPRGGSTDLWGDVAARSGQGRGTAAWPSRPADHDDPAGTHEHSGGWEPQGPTGSEPFPQVRTYGDAGSFADPFAGNPSRPTPPAGYPYPPEGPSSGGWGGSDSWSAESTGGWAAADSASAPMPVVPPGAAVDGVLLGVIRRLRAQAARQAALAERLRANENRPGPLADLAELAAVARRTRRDSDTVLTLAGAEPVRRAGGPVPLAALVEEVLSGVEDAPRVVVSPPAAALVAPAPADGLGAVLAELLAHTGATTAPGARIDLVSHWTHDGGLAVEVLVAGAALRGDEADDLQYRLDDPAPEGMIAADRVGLFVAARLARRAGIRVDVRADPEHPPAPGLALVAGVLCPPAVLVAPAEQPHAGGADALGADAFGADAFGTGAFGAVAPGPASGSFAPVAPSDPGADEPAGEIVFGKAPSGAFPESPTTMVDVGQRFPDSETRSITAYGGIGARNGTAAAPGEPEAPPIRIEETPLFAAASAAVTSPTEGDAALFGPLDPRSLAADAWSPIYEEMASAWFRTDADPGAHRSTDADWGDDGGWGAAARLATEPEDLPTTASGLPQRRPGRQMVPPPRNETVEGGVGVGARVERVPDRVRSRLSSYQRGLQEGRHRAGGEEDPED